MTTRPAMTADLPAIADIYAHWVLHTVASFELEPPGAGEWQVRFDAAADAGLPFLVAERDGRIAGYGYCLPWSSRPAYQGTADVRSQNGCHILKIDVTPMSQVAPVLTQCHNN